jgi:hypothetical protein
MESIGTFEWRYTLSSIRPRGVVEDKSGNYTLWELPEYKQNNKPERVAMGNFNPCGLMQDGVLVVSIHITNSMLEVYLEFHIPS